MKQVNLVNEIIINSKQIREFLGNEGLKNELLGTCNFNTNMDEAVQVYEECVKNDVACIMYKTANDNCAFVVNADNISKATGNTAVDEIEKALIEIIESNSKDKYFKVIKSTLMRV